MLAKLAAMGGGDTGPIYVDDVFSAYTYTGNGSTLTINNGIDLAGKGGLVWLKSRGANRGHYLCDTIRGAQHYLSPNNNFNQDNYGTPTNALNSFNSNGFSIGADTLLSWINVTNDPAISWTFRKAPKFFDVVTWTGNGSAGRAIPHSLGSIPGMLVIKATSLGGTDWIVYHQSLGASQNLRLNTTGAVEPNGGAYFQATTPTANAFYVSANVLTNANGETYVAYLFAHDSSTDGIIQCGSFTTNGSGLATVNLGWEPQYVMVKPTTTGEWDITDTSRGMSQTRDKTLRANVSDAELDWGVPATIPTATGFTASGSYLGASTTYIYMAIRRPNKPPTVGTQVYKGLLHTATGAIVQKTGVGFAPDLLISQSRSGAYGSAFQDRLRGATKNLVSNATLQEVARTTSLTSFNQDGVTLGADDANQFNYGGTYIEHFFKRTPGVFDIVCYTGTGAAQNIPHNLTVAPELMIVKNRTNGATQWYVYHSAYGGSQYLWLNSATAMLNSSGVFDNAAFSASTFPVNTAADVNGAGASLVAYLFATKAGISKVGYYSGTDASGQIIDCGFTTGARFVLIKARDAFGKWYVFDSERGIVSDNDVYQSLSDAVVEGTNTDPIDPHPSGFMLNNAAPYLNSLTKDYIFLAFA